MKTNLIFLLVGSIVPLTLSIFYFLKNFEYLRFRHNILFEGNSLALSCLFNSNLFVINRYAKLKYFEKLFFSKKYLDLIDMQTQKLINQIDNLSSYSCKEDSGNIYRSFMFNWKLIHELLFKEGLYDDTCESFTLKSSWEEVFKIFFPSVGNKLSEKMFELYEKEALKILRTKGYFEFSEFIEENEKLFYKYRNVLGRKIQQNDESKIKSVIFTDSKLPTNKEELFIKNFFDPPFKVKSLEENEYSLSVNIIRENSNEISEKIESEIKKIHKEGNKAINMNNLQRTFVLNQRRFLKKGDRGNENNSLYKTLRKIEQKIKALG